MTERHPLTDLLTDAVAEAPATAVTAATTFRRGRRRRTAVRAGTTCAIVAVLAAAGVAGWQFRQSPDAVGPATQLDPLPSTPTRCADLAEAVQSVAEATLPADINWTGTKLPEGADDCAGGGLFWVNFTAEGGSHTLGFEGGPGADGKACDPERQVVRCDKGDGYEIGHYRSAGDYGVLYGRSGLFFFLGLGSEENAGEENAGEEQAGKEQAGKDRPLTTDQLAMVAKEVDRVIYRG